MKAPKFWIDGITFAIFKLQSWRNYQKNAKSLIFYILRKFLSRNLKFWTSKAKQISIKKVLTDIDLITYIKTIFLRNFLSVTNLKIHTCKIFKEKQFLLNLKWIKKFYQLAKKVKQMYQNHLLFFYGDLIEKEKTYFPERNMTTYSVGSF